jgi:hypothetical protein
MLEAGFAKEYKKDVKVVESLHPGLVPGLAVPCHRRNATRNDDAEKFSVKLRTNLAEVSIISKGYPALEVT